MRPALLAVVLASAALPASAPPPAAAQAMPFCRTGRPAPECGTFPVATLNYYPGSRATSEADIPWKLVEWEGGWMTNVAPAHAVGASVALGTGETGFHVAVKGRYRRWLDRGLALDADAGLLLAQHPPQTYPHETLAGLTGGVSFGLTDWIAVGGQARVLWGASDGEAVTGVEVGVRLGTLPGAVATVLGGAYLVGAAMGGT